MDHMHNEEIDISTNPLYRLDDYDLEQSDEFEEEGFDDIDISEYFNPAITTIRNPIARQGIMAVNELFGMITQGNKGQKISLTGDLVVRNSTSVPNQER